MLAGGLWILTIIGCLLGVFQLTEAIFARNGATQGAGAAMAVAMAVLPYCLARAVQELRRK